MRDILVIRAGAIGDGLLTLPALGALRSRWPEARLTLIGPRSLLPFALVSGLAQQGQAIEGSAGLALLGAESATAPEWASADLAIVWLQRGDDVVTRLRQWGCRQVLGGASFPSPGQPLHVADVLMEALAPLGVGPSRLSRPLGVASAAEAAAEKWWGGAAPADRPVVALHPGSGGRRKCWPAERYAALAQRLCREGVTALVCLGPAEAELAASWAAFVQKQGGCFLAEGLELPVLAAVLRRCAGFIGNDAGVTHLAALMAIPTVAIFGPTDPALWAPLGPRVRVLRDAAWRDDQGTADWTLAPETVAQAWKHLVRDAGIPAPFERKDSSG